VNALRTLRWVAAAIAVGLTTPAWAQEPAAADAAASLTPEEAFRRGYMPLAATGVDQFRKAYPTYDGRGVIIAIMDSGLDPGIPGLATTSTGERKVLDLRDFSGEGSVPLTRLTPTGDTLSIGGQQLSGVARLKTIAAGGRFWGGVLKERPLGAMPAADVNGDGDDADALAVVVVRASDGWVVFADTDGDGSLADEKPVHDYLVGKETVGWHPAGKAAPLNVGVNLRDEKGVPKLNLVFDTSGHGSHVAGIAAGHDMYGVKGFDGVAPGAYLLGLKLANNAQGGITTNGSIMAALDYAIRFATNRRLPLVINLSFGVGNEVEGAAAIDQMVDSVLTAHPELVFTIAAGNDGPGLTTMGFPGSATRALTIGGTYPAPFTGGTTRGGDPIAFFSSRGGELAKPDIVTPAVAFSTVPQWNRGDEQKNGTSMASPHAAGLAALLRSSLVQVRKSADARQIRQALMVTARPIAGLAYVDQGTGQPEIGAAWRWLEAGRAVPDIQVRAADHGVTAALRTAPFATADSVQGFTLTLPRTATAELTWRSTAPWLRAPAATRLQGGANAVTVVIDRAALSAPGLYSGVVTGWTGDSLLGPVARLVTTVVVPDTGALMVRQFSSLSPGGEGQLFFNAEAGRPFAVIVGTRDAREQGIAYLHEPGGQPYREQNGIPAGAGEQAALFVVDGRDAVAGTYEAVAVASPYAGMAPTIAVQQSPYRIQPTVTAGQVAIKVDNRSPDSLRSEPFLVTFGAERVQVVTGTAADTGRVQFTIPSWAVHAVIDATMDRAAWGRFTDFGFTLFDADGRQMGQAPLNYDLSRMQVPLPPSTGADRNVEVRLFPGLASASDKAPWTAQVRIKLYADSTHIAQAAGTPITLPANGSAVSTVSWTPPVFPLGTGFVPLAVVVVPENERAWTFELPLKTAP
jgi:subtilisin family serine protease